MMILNTITVVFLLFATYNLIVGMLYMRATKTFWRATDAYDTYDALAGDSLHAEGLRLYEAARRFDVFRHRR